MFVPHFMMLTDYNLTLLLNKNQGGRGKRTDGQGQEGEEGRWTRTGDKDGRRRGRTAEKWTGGGRGKPPPRAADKDKITPLEPERR